MYSSHLNHSTDPGKLGFLVSDSGYPHFHYFEYDESHDEKPPTCSIRMIDFTPPFPPSNCKFFGSSNGLICLYVYRDNVACICNPVTKEYVRLPKIKREFIDPDEYGHYLSGFGYDSLTRVYKVVELYASRLHPNIINVMVYTLGNGNGWRNVGKEVMHPHCHIPGVYANGAIHWMDDIRRMILVFDLSEEKFRQHLLLPPLPQDYMSRRYEYTIGELCGVLYCAIRGRHSDIWLLKVKNDYPDMEEEVENEPFFWRKEFSLPGMEPLAFTKSGGVLCFDYSSFGVYDTAASTLKKILRFTSCSRIFPHINTLVSLKELGEEEIKTMKSDEIEEIESRDLAT